MEIKKIIAICIKLIGNFEIPGMNLSFDYNNFIPGKNIYSLSRVRKVFFNLFNFIAIIGKQKYLFFSILLIKGRLI